MERVRTGAGPEREQRFLRGRASENNSNDLTWCSNDVPMQLARSHIFWDTNARSRTGPTRACSTTARTQCER
eukprot:2785155-Pyramimonas_sp.AAC.1